MTKYLNSKIYKLHSYDNELVYIGSTIQTLSQRYGGHKANFKKNQTTTSKILFENSENVIITLIKLFPCNCKGELETEERKYIENVECVNKKIPTQTQKEYHQKNKDAIAEYLKEYNQKNKDAIAEYQKEYYQKNKDAITEHQKEYRQKNKDAIIEYSKEYYQNNKGVLSDKKKEYYQNNKDAIIEQKKIYKQKNKEKIRHYDYWRRNKNLFGKIKPLFYNI